VKLIKTLFLLLTATFFLTSCSSVVKNEAYLKKEKQRIVNSALIFASTTADKDIGSMLITSMKLENIKTGKEIDLNIRTCKITKNSQGMGALAKLIINWKTDGKPIKDQINKNGNCGSLLLGILEAGKYQLKQIEVNVFENGEARWLASIKYTPPRKKIFNVNKDEIVYLGNIHTEILEMTLGYRILKSSISMQNNYLYDSKIFKDIYKEYESSVIKNNTIRLEKKIYD